MYYKAPLNFKAYKCVILFFLVLVTTVSFGQSQVQTRKIQHHYDASKLMGFTSEWKADYTQQRKNLLSLAEAKGWKISEKLPNGGYTELQELGADGTPLYYTTFSDYVTNVSRANSLYSSGLLQLGIDGKGMKVGVWDGGTALTSHQEFDSRLSIGDETAITSLHATMVTGTLIASGLKQKAKGVAYSAYAVSNDWTRDKIEVAEAAANGMLLSNHSYGIQTDRVPDWYFGSYIKVSQDWDHIMYNAPYYVMVTAAGNSQKLGDNAAPIHGSTLDGFDLLLGFALSKNGITVAAADTKIDANGSLTQGTATEYTSFGPVDDGRIKPDITGAGGSIYSTSSKGNSLYDTSIGTSMATPGITGSMLLLQQYYEKLNGSYMRAATLKGLVLHSADDVDQPGPDYKLGWGIMNSMAAANMITNNDFSTLISEKELTTGAFYEIKVKAAGNVPLVASISWTDPAATYVNTGILNDATPALVNDLDIRISKDGTTFYPWILSAKNASLPATGGDNVVDPFEKIEIANASGEYTIRVSHKGILTNEGQNFSLIVSGIAVTDCTLETPTAVEIFESTPDAIRLGWNPIKDAMVEVQYAAENTDSWITTYTNESNIVLSGLQRGVTYKLRLRTSCTETKTSEYGEELVFEFLGEETRLGELTRITTLSIKENISITVFPNPATEYIVVDGELSDSAMYRILSSSGALMKQGSVDSAGIDVNQLSSGLYVLVVKDSKGSKSTKFYKS